MRRPNGKVTITIEEASNGKIVTIGDTVRVCLDDGELLEQIAAALAEETMDGWFTPADPAATLEKLLEDIDK